MIRNLRTKGRSMNFEKSYLNIHVLTSHSPSCLNRDDMNMQKSAIFGGVRRVRISSQCLKRAIRKSEAYEKRLGKPSIRTLALAHLADRYTQALAGKFPEDLVRRTIALVAGKDDVPDKGDAVAPWSVAEVAKLCEIVQSAEADQLDQKKLLRRVQEQSAPLREAMARQVDIALFGRMATSGLMQPIDGAMSVAHVLTTHAVDADIDWFTAVDDLTQEEGETGAGHLNTQEFGAGVFYRYASLNLPRLAENMGETNTQKPLDVAAHLVHLFATVVPQAKQNSFAAYNLADLVCVSLADLPVSAANAFEKPVGPDNVGGLREPSVRAFEEYVQTVRAGYGLEERSAVFSILDTCLTPRLNSLAELEQWVRNGGS